VLGRAGEADASTTSSRHASQSIGTGGACSPNYSLTYDIVAFRRDSIADTSSGGLSPATAVAALGGDVHGGRGVFCPRPDLYRQPPPDVPDRFSGDIETVAQSMIRLRLSSLKPI